jgi:hypothetical protein
MLWGSFSFYETDLWLGFFLSIGMPFDIDTLSLIYAVLLLLPTTLVGNGGY